VKSPISIDSVNTSISILGCGWLGERIGKLFLEKGLSIRGSSRSEKRLGELKPMGIEPFKVDLEELSEINEAFFDVDILIVATTNKNHQVHQELVELIDKSTIKRIFFVSSTSVYEKTKEELSVDSRLVTSALVEVEKVYRNSKKSCILRCGGLIGDNRQPGNFFKKGAIIKNPDGRVNLIHFKKVAETILSLIENGNEHQIYNLIEESQLSRIVFYSKAYRDLQGESGEFLRED